MTLTAHSVEVRVYNVGLGDCILLTFRSKKTKSSKTFVTKRVLIDFGSTGRNKNDGPALDEVAQQIVHDCTPDSSEAGSSKSPQLDAIVVTHRHRDHLAGFGGKSGTHLEGLKPSLLVQPWTENPKTSDADLSTSSSVPGAVQHVQCLRAGQELTETIVREILARSKFDLRRETDEEVLAYGAKNLPFRTAAANSEPDIDSELSEALGAEKLANSDAIERLYKLVPEEGREYLSEGETTGLEKLVEGLEVDILGPVGPDHWNQLKQAGDSDELWKRIDGLRQGLDASSAEAVGKVVEFEDKEGPYGVPAIFDSDHQDNTAVYRRKDNVRWLIRQLDALRGKQLLRFVRLLDSHLNNTSLVLLLKFGDFRMLFPGDAEVASWRMITRSRSGSQNESVIQKLREVDLYKVGHHGSNNATPVLSLWPHLMDSRESDRPLHCLLSTQLTKFEGAIPNRQLYRELVRSPDVRLMTTAFKVPKLPAPDQADWTVNRSPDPDKAGIVMSYSREFPVARRRS